jgi:hypothetical protein
VVKAKDANLEEPEETEVLMRQVVEVVQVELVVS